MDDAGDKLLAAVEALQAEVRELRKEVREDRVSCDALVTLRSANAARQAKYRLKSQNSNVTSRHSNVTHEVVKALDLDPVKLKQVLTTPALRHNNVSNVTGPTRESYSKAYLERHGASPVWNATTNSQLSRFVKRVGAEEAPEIAAFYVKHRASFYVQKLHPVGLLLQDSEKLRTEWFTGKAMTATEAHQGDKTAANMDGWLDLMSQEGRDALVGK